MTAMSSAVSQSRAWLCRPGEYPTIAWVYQSCTTTMEIQPKPWTSTWVMSMPHHSLGLLGFGGGGFERAYITLTRGIHVEAGEMTPETVAARFEAISDRANELVPEGGFVQAGVALGQI